MRFKNLFFVILLVLLTFVLASCGGSGGGGKKDEKGATMTAEELNTRFTEANEVGDAISTAGDCLEMVRSAGSTYFKSQGMRSMAEDAEGSEEEGLKWSSTPDADGWYTATDTDTWTEEKELGVSITVNWTGTYKLRYLAKSATIELSGTEVYSYSDGSSETFVEFLHIVKGTNGLWNGYKTSDMSSSVEGHHTAKIEFKNLMIDGSGEFIAWIDGKKIAEIIITVVGTQATVSGTTYDEHGNPTKLEKTVTI